jgi:serine acetyltransferase
VRDVPAFATVIGVPAQVQEANHRSSRVAPQVKD